MQLITGDGSYISLSSRFWIPGSEIDIYTFTFILIVYCCCRRFLSNLACDDSAQYKSLINFLAMVVIFCCLNSALCRPPSRPNLLYSQHMAGCSMTGTLQNCLLAVFCIRMAGSAKALALVLVWVSILSLSSK